MKAKIQNAELNIFSKLYYGLFFLLSFIYSGELVDPVLIPRQIYLTVFVFVIGIIICYWIYKRKLPADFSFIKLTLPLLFFIFITTIIISFSQTIDISESIYVLSKVSLEILFFIITTYLLIHKKITAELFIKSVIVFSIITVLIAFYQILKIYFSGKSFFENIEMINATNGNKNSLSSILFLTLPFVIGSVFLTKPWKIVSVVLIFIIMVLFWVIQAKAVIAAFIIFLILFLFLFLKFRKNAVNKHYTKIILIAAALIIVVASIITVQNKQTFYRITNPRTIFLRFSAWENSALMIKDNFFFGVGAGNWQVQFPKYGLDKFVDIDKAVKDGIITYQRPHNDFLWVFCEQGVFGLLAYILIFATILFYLYKLLKKSEKWDDKWLYASFFAAIAGYIMIAFVDFPLERIEHQLLLFLMFSIITAHYYNLLKTDKTSKKTMVKLPVLIIFLVVPVLFSFIISVSRCSGEYHTHKMYDARSAANWKLMVKEADKAVSSYYVMDPMSVPISWYKGVALFSSGNINKAKTSFENAYKIHPYNIHVLNNLASCYESMGEHKKAEEFYLKALSISSDFEEARLNLSAVYFNMKDYEKAFEIIDKCDVNCVDPKYQSFLPAILKSWIDDVISKQSNEVSIKKLTEIKTDKEKILNFYFEAKKNNTNFIQYILNN